MKSFLAVLAIALLFNSSISANPCSDNNNKIQLVNRQEHCQSSGGSKFEKVQNVLILGALVAAFVMADDFWVLIGVEDPMSFEE